MSSTRLLVLGVVRIFQPAHGYSIRRELLSWGVERWAHVNPGSIYNALRMLTREGLLAETDPERSAGRAGRTSYRLTVDGENAYYALLRDALWNVDEFDSSVLLAGLSFMTSLRRAEVIDAMEARQDALRNLVKSVGHSVDHITDARLVPAHTRELFDVEAARLVGELAWCADFVERVRAEHYIFCPEPGWNAGPGPHGWLGPLDKTVNQT